MIAEIEGGVIIAIFTIALIGVTLVNKNPLTNMICNLAVR